MLHLLHVFLHLVRFFCHAVAQAGNIVEKLFAHCPVPHWQLDPRTITELANDAIHVLFNLLTRQALIGWPLLMPIISLVDAKTSSGQSGRQVKATCM